MTGTLAEKRISCPYCGETVDALVDPSVSHQTYVEDCAVCCRPMLIDAVVDSDGDIDLAVHRSD